MSRPRVLFTAAPGVIMWPDGAVQVETSVPPMALYSLVAVVEDAGFSCTLLDPVEFFRRCRTDQELRNIVGDHGVFCISANSNTWAAAACIIAKVAKLDPRPVIVVGGLHASYCDEHMLHTTEVDFIVRGEGEATLPELLRALAQGAPTDNIEGISFRADDTVVRTPERPPLDFQEMSSQPLPAWDRLPLEVYDFLPIELSRGCKFRCSFCSIYHRNCWRAPTLNEARRRIRHLVSHLHRVSNHTLMLSDDCFTSDPEFVEAVTTIIEEEAPGVGVGIEARAGDVLEPKIREALRRLNIEFIQLGVECGYAEGLKRVRKAVSLDRVIASAHSLHELGIRSEAKYSYITGFPWETESDMKRTIAFAMGLGSRYGNQVQVNWHMASPGSELFEGLATRGLVWEGEFDVWPPERTGHFERTHPTVSRETAWAIEEYASLLRTTYPWVGTLGNVFRLWPRHAHLPADRLTPGRGGASSCDWAEDDAVLNYRERLPSVLQVPDDVTGRE